MKQNQLKTQKSNHMKKFLLALAFLIPAAAFAQLSTSSPDTVCYQTSGSTYSVTNMPGYTYTWTVTSPGVLVSGQGTNQISVDWSAAAPGAIANGVSVYATNASGCTSDPVVIDIFILNIVPTITAIGPFCETDPCVTLSGTPPGGTWSGTGVVGNQFCPGTSGTGTFPITYTVTQAGCTFTATTNATVNTIPILSPIQHN